MTRKSSLHNTILAASSLVVEGVGQSWKEVQKKYHLTAWGGVVFEVKVLRRLIDKKRLVIGEGNVDMLEINVKSLEGLSSVFY